MIMFVLLLIPAFLLLPVLYYSAIGLAEYAKYNNTKPSLNNYYTNPEKTWDSVDDEYNELLESINSFKLFNIYTWFDIIMEFGDVCNALMKHYIILYLPAWFYTQPYIWVLTSLLVFPVSFKLGCRYITHSCIRNHKTSREGKAKNHICNHRSTGKLNVYYSCSVRGGTKANAAKTIEIMEKYTNVLTKHLAKDNPDEDFADSDAEIYKKDIQLLGQADIMIADVSNASLGVGFMIQTALRLGKPVHCFNSNDNLSAMIAGCPELVIHRMDETFETCFTEIVGKYHNDNNLKYSVQHPNVIIIGPAGSGKSTVGRKLAETYGKVYISTGELLRQLNDKHPYYKMVKELMDKGKMIPANIMSQILKDKLKSPEVVINGFILDGYPQSFDDCNEFNNIYNVSDIDIVFKFECDKETCVARQCDRGTRTSDNKKTAGARFDIYMQNVPSSIDMMKLHDWFPYNLVVPIDATMTPDTVWNTVLTNYRFLNYKNVPKEYSYMLFEPTTERHNSRFHYHIDGESHKSIHQMSLDLFRKHPRHINHLKIYPIDQLALGNQSNTDPAYANMMNFHSIKNGDINEAFVTGCLQVPTRRNIDSENEAEYIEEHGEQADNRFMEGLYGVLDTAVQHHIETGEKTMVELEEYIGEYKMLANGKDIIIVYEYVPYDNIFLKQIDCVYPSEYNNETPPLEFHHGFDIEKTDEEPSFTLTELNAYSDSVGINNGGWFIFKNDKYWKYRSNEFVRPKQRDYLNLNDLPALSKQHKELREQLISQTKLLDIFLKQKMFAVDITSSIEIVHGIWNFK
jgi:adenylate kinase family enzyme